MKNHLTKTLKRAILAITVIALISNVSVAFAATTVGTNITTTGKIGAGTASPTENLHVIGAGLFDFTGTSTGTLTIGTPLGTGPGTIALSPGGNRRDIRFSNTGMSFLVSSSSSAPGSIDGIVITEDPFVGIGTTSPSAKLEVEVANAEDTQGIYIDNNDSTNNTAGLIIDMVSGAGIPLGIIPTASAPASGIEGGLYADSTTNNLYYYDGTTWVDLTASGSGYWNRSATILTVGTSGDDVRFGSDDEELIFGDLGEISFVYDKLGDDRLEVTDGTNLLMALQDIGTTGDLVVSGNYIASSQGDIVLNDSDNSNYLSFQAPATVSTNVTWTLPSADGTSGQVLSTNGSGTLSWASAGTGNTLDAAYDQGGSGSGRAITVDSSAVQLTGSNAADETLEVSQSANFDTIDVLASNTAFSNTILEVNANEEDTGAFNFIELNSDLDGTPDVELTINQDGDITTDGQLTIGDGATITSSTGLTVVPNGGDDMDITLTSGAQFKVNTTEFVVEQGGAVGIGKSPVTRLDIEESADFDVVNVLASNVAFTGSTLKMSSNEEDTGSFYFLELVSDADGTPDTELLITQDGTIVTDGGITSSGDIAFDATTFVIDSTANQVEIGAGVGTTGILNVDPGQSPSGGGSSIFLYTGDAATSSAANGGNMILNLGDGDGAGTQGYLDVLDSGGSVLRVEPETDVVTINSILQLQGRSGAPSSPVNGMIYYDSDTTGALCVRLNGGWVVAAGTGSCG